MDGDTVKEKLKNEVPQAMPTFYRTSELVKETVQLLKASRDLVHDAQAVRKQRVAQGVCAENHERE